MKGIGRLENFNRVILFGTSHTVPRWNTMGTFVTDNYDVEFSNYGIYALGIESYFSRMHGIMNKHKKEKCLIFAEIPTIGRYQDYYRKNLLEYKEWDMVDGLPGFWSDQSILGTEDRGVWEKYICYYGISKLWNGEDLEIDKKTIKSILRVKTMSDRRMEAEEQISKLLAINALIKMFGHQVIWFSVDNNIIYETRVQREFSLHNFKTIGNFTLDHKVCELYNFKPDDENIRKNVFIYPDGYHLHQKVWTKLIKKYFESYFNQLIN